VKQRHPFRLLELWRGISEPREPGGLLAPRATAAHKGEVMRHIGTCALVLIGVVALTTGCATKKWVREVVGQQEVQTDQKLARADAESRQQAARIVEHADRLNSMGTKVDGLERSVGDVSDRANTALAKADDTDKRLTRLWSQRHTRQQVEAVAVHFGFDRWDLDDGAQTALMTIVQELQKNPRLTVDLQGYTDPVGTQNYNIGLSQRRVEAVRRYLVKQGIEQPRIQAVGMGPLMDRDSKEEAAKRRRVSVNLMLYPE
jgi:outer membrane protein OmpA-like peptidoglycan-associated protein